MVCLELYPAESEVTKSVSGRVRCVQDSIWQNVVSPRLHHSECWVSKLYLAECRESETLSKECGFSKLYLTECGVPKTLMGKVWGVLDCMIKSVGCPRVYLAQ